MEQKITATQRYNKYQFRGLNGRFGYWPSRKKALGRTFVLLYGQHSTLERLEVFAEVLSEYGEVYAVDAPGFGGMEPSYKLNTHPSLAFFADNLENFINSRIGPEKIITIVGISYGFQVATQLLGTRPLLAERTEAIISFVGFMSYRDFVMPAAYNFWLKNFIGNLGRLKFGSKIIDVFTSAPGLRAIYLLSKRTNVRTKNMPKEEFKGYVDGQLDLWHNSDNRTHAATAWDFWHHNDLTSFRIRTACYHVGVPNDHLLDNKRIVDEMSVVYRPFEAFELGLDTHAPVDELTPDVIKGWFPDKIKTVLSKSLNQEVKI